MAVAASEIVDVLVQLTGSAEDDVRLATALRLADEFGAQVVGVHLHVLPDVLDITDPMQSGTIRELLEDSDREADRTFELAARKFDAVKTPHELRRLHGLAAGVATDLAAMARTTDLFVGTRPYGEPDGHTEIEERVIFGSGRGGLFLPPGGSPHTRFGIIVVAWDGSREASRAVAEAMPFLRRATAVHLVSVAQPGDDTSADKHFAAIGAHLQRHGVEATRTLLPYITGIGEQVEQFAHQKGADLIVMGAYGHSRMSEWVFGGVTRYILRHSTLPVLMAH